MLLKVKFLSDWSDVARLGWDCWLGLLPIAGCSATLHDAQSWRICIILGYCNAGSVHLNAFISFPVLVISEVSHSGIVV